MSNKAKKEYLLKKARTYYYMAKGTRQQHYLIKARNCINEIKVLMLSEVL
jgi:hypothetical protein